MAMAFDMSRLESSDLVGRLATLRHIKNSIVGHAQEKEKWIRRDISNVVRIVDGSLSHRVTTSNGLKDNNNDVASLVESCKIQALWLLSSFAGAGPEYLLPLNHAGALSAILACCRPQDNSAEIVRAALRALRSIVKSAALVNPVDAAESPITPETLSETLFSYRQQANTLVHILRQPSSNPHVPEQISIVASLIGSLCRKPKYQLSLTQSGVLDALATLLAGFAVAEGQAIPFADSICRTHGLTDFFPSPATRGLDMAAVLHAIAMIVNGSRYCAAMLLYNPSILSVFPQTESAGAMYSDTAFEIAKLPSLNPSNQDEYGPMDLLLPYIPAQLPIYPINGHGPSVSDNLPKRVPGHVTRKQAESTTVLHKSVSSLNGPDGNRDTEETLDEESESPLAPWLISLVRTRNKYEAFGAASILTTLFKARLTYKSRQAMLCLFIVPKLLHILNDPAEKKKDDDSNILFDLVAQTAGLLGTLLADSEPLQKAAISDDATKIAKDLLEASYEVDVPLTSLPWCPNPDVAATTPTTAPPGLRLGQPGLHPTALHCIRVREGALRALSSLASLDEDERKNIGSTGPVSYIVKSLSRHPSRSKPGDTIKKSESETDGHRRRDCNPEGVIIAACSVLRMLSRSVHNIRTVLVDVNIANTLLQLMEYPGLDVQNAATSAICNLVTELSPMREDLIKDGVAKILCRHAKSEDPTMRLSALWALKHLAYATPLEFKKRCLQELQPDWLVRLISHDIEDDTAMAAQSSTSSPSDEDVKMSDRTAASKESTQIALLRTAEARLAKVRECDLDLVVKARMEDLAIQEQALGFIRNLTGGAQSQEQENDAPQMIDYLFETIGQEVFFRLLYEKLKTRTLHPFSNRRGPTSSEARVVSPQPRIVATVVYILVHIAASVPSHRQLVVAQTQLLPLVAEVCCDSPDHEVRLSLCHLISNLTWQDDVKDLACLGRSHQLENLGFVERLEAMQQKDEELEVRERAKTALWQMQQQQQQRS